MLRYLFNQILVLRYLFSYGDGGYVGDLACNIWQEKECGFKDQLMNLVSSKIAWWDFFLKIVVGHCNCQNRTIHLARNQSIACKEKLKHN